MTDRLPANADRNDLSRRIEELTRQWAGLIRSAAVRYRLEPVDFDEVVQQVRLRLWRALERHGGDADKIAPAYAYQAAVSAAIDLVRGHRTRRRLDPLVTSGEGGSREPESRGGSPDEAAVLARLARGLDGLDSQRRVAVRLHLAGRHLSEIARVAGWTEAKARNLLYRGLDDLRRALAEED